MTEKERQYKDECGLDHGGTNSAGDPCGRPAGWGTDFDSGKCKHHRGTSPDGKSHEDNGFAETHGLTADAEKWFERHRDDVEDDVKAMVTDWMQLAPFGWEVSGNVRMLVNAAINECQIEQGDRYIRENDVIVDKPISAGEGVAFQQVENPAFGYKSKLQKDTLRILNKFGILDSPEKQQADALGNLTVEINHTRVTEENVDEFVDE